LDLATGAYAKTAIAGHQATILGLFEFTSTSWTIVAGVAVSYALRAEQSNRQPVSICGAQGLEAGRIT